jgi:hypothetical protein
LSSNDLGSIVGAVRNRWTGDLHPSTVPAAGAKATRLQMRFNAAKCVETTHGEPGTDEISLAGVAVDNLGAVSAIGPLPLGQFADGQLTVVLDGQPLRTSSPAATFQRRSPSCRFSPRSIWAASTSFSRS